MNVNAGANARKAKDVVTDSIGNFLKKARESRRMSLAEVSRVTRIPVATIEALEGDHFDDLPGEVFVRGFLKSYAQAVRLVPDDVLARYTACRRLQYVTPLPAPPPIAPGAAASPETRGKRFGVAIAFVLLLILFTLAISIVLKPRGHDMPAELSQRSAPAHVLARG
jgi:cytoskeletal protein RodZ